MFNDEPDSNQKVKVDIVFDPEKIEYIHKMALKYDLNPPKVIPKYELRVEIPIGEYRSLIRDLDKDNIKSSVVSHYHS